MFEVPSTDLHVALILVQTLGERFGISLAASRAPLAILSAAVVSLTSNCVVRLLSWGAGTATKHPTNCMADRRADCYTAVSKSVYAVSRREQGTI